MTMIRARRWIGLTLIVAVVVAVFGASSRVTAISNQMPDGSEYGAAGGSIALALSKTPNVISTSIVVPLYVKSPQSAPPGNVTVTLDVIWQKKAGILACTGGSAFSASGTFTVLASSFVWDSVNNLWRSPVNVSLCNEPTIPVASNNTILFRLIAPSGGNYIFGYTPPGGAGLFATDASAGSSTFSDYSLPFATPCDITSNTPGTIRLDDLDSGLVDNSGRIISVYVTNSSGVSIPLTRSGSDGNNVPYYIGMTFQPNEKYILHVNNVHRNNMLIFRMPFENVAYVNGCISYDLNPISTVSQAKIVPGQAVTGINASIDNTGATATDSNSATAVVRFVVPSSGGSILYPSGGATSLTDNAGFGCKLAAVVASGIRDCTDSLHVDAVGRIFNKGSTSLLAAGTDELTGVSLSLGDKVCYMTVVNRYGVGRSVNDWRYSELRCIVVLQPLVFQVWGNDTRVGSSLVPGGRKDNAQIISGLQSVAESKVSPTLISQDGLAGGMTSSTCRPWAEEDRNIIRLQQSSGLLSKLKEAYGPSTLLVSSYSNAPGLASRYIPPTSGYIADGAIPNSGSYNKNTCLEHSTNTGKYVIDVASNKINPIMAEKWKNLINTAFASGDSGSTIRTLNTSPTNTLASWRLPASQNDPNNPYRVYFDQFIKDASGAPSNQYQDYQIWSVGGNETPQQNRQRNFVYYNRTAGASAYRQTFDVDCSAIAGVDSTRQEETGLILFSMQADDFGAAYLNGNLLSREAVGLPLGDVGSRAGRIVTAAISTSDLKCGGADNGRGNLLEIINLDKISEQNRGVVADTGVGIMYSISYFAPKVPSRGQAYYGSWGEYGVIAPSAVDGFASGAGLAAGASSATLSQATNHRLTFANKQSTDSACTPVVFGCFAPASELGTPPDIVGYLTSAGKTGYTLNQDLSTGAKTLGTMTSVTGTTVYYYPNATVNLNGNGITYAPGPHAEGDLPQIIIIAKNITISKDVTSIDAWLIAKGTDGDGTINTCGDVTGAPHANDGCEKRLTVNGAVIANHLILRRTSFDASGADPTAPAEVFNLRGDAYLWARSVVAKNSGIKTIGVRELAPRY